MEGNKISASYAAFTDNKTGIQMKCELLSPLFEPVLPCIRCDLHVYSLKYSGAPKDNNNSRLCAIPSKHICLFAHLTRDQASSKLNNMKQTLFIILCVKPPQNRWKKTNVSRLLQNVKSWSTSEIQARSSFPSLLRNQKRRHIKS